MEFGHPPCSDCPAKVLCRCLQVTEEAVVDAITSLDLRTIRDVRRHTGSVLAFVASASRNCP